MKRNTPDHWKMDDLANRLGVGIAQAVGHMEMLFHLTAKQAIHGNIGKIPNASIAKKCGWDGDADVFVNALIASKWIDECPDQRLVVHDWHEHCDDATKKAVQRSGIDFFKPKTPLPDNGGQNPPKSDNGVLPSLAKPSPSLPSHAQPPAADCVQDSSKVEDFIGPKRNRVAEDSGFIDPLSDFEPEVAAKARHFWQLFCVQHHGPMLRNVHLEASQKEMRHFAKAIAAFGQQAINALESYYKSPPKADKQKFAHQIILGLGLQAQDSYAKVNENAKQAKMDEILKKKKPEW